MVDRLRQAPEEIRGMVPEYLLRLENQTELHLVRSVAEPYVYEDKFALVFGRSESTQEDRDLAKSLTPDIKNLQGLTFMLAYHPSVCDERGYRKPGTLDKFPGMGVSTRQVHELLQMSTLVAVQPEIINPSNRHEEMANGTIVKARLMTEVLWGALTDEEKVASIAYPEMTVLHERYLPKRNKHVESVRPYMSEFEQKLRSEFNSAVMGSTSLSWNPIYSPDIASIPRIDESVGIYKAKHPFLPWAETS